MATLTANVVFVTPGPTGPDGATPERGAPELTVVGPEAEPPGTVAVVAVSVEVPATGRAPGASPEDPRAPPNVVPVPAWLPDGPDESSVAPCRGVVTAQADTDRASPAS